MLIQLLIQQPRAIGAILMQTPTWVWALLAGLIALGASQLHRREVTLRRTVLLPLSMALLSLYGLIAALGNAHALPTALALWALAAGCTAGAALLWQPAPPKGCRYDTATACFHLPGSAVPLALILAIFLTKYGVGVELAMQPQHVHDSVFAHTLATVYGVFNGILFARTARLWQLMKDTVAQSIANAT
jgi:hypothetical protein